MSSFSGSVASGANDALDKDDGSSFTSSGTTADVISSTTSSTRSDAGFRFQNVTIPQGATISAATIQVWLNNGTKNNNVLAHLFCEAVDNSVDFTTTAHVSSRSRTSASAAWSATGLSPAGLITSPDISAAVQEVINRAGWASGNALTVLLCGDNSATSRTLRITTYDGASADAAVLSITYSVNVDVNTAAPAAEGLAAAAIAIITGDANLTSISAEALASTGAASVSGDANVTAVAADVLATAPVSSVSTTANVNITAPAAEALAGAPPADASTSSSPDVSITVDLAGTVLAGAPSPSVSVPQLVAPDEGGAPQPGRRQPTPGWKYAKTGTGIVACAGSGTVAWAADVDAEELILIGAL